MAWDTDTVLEGIFTFGGPLNVHRWQVDTGKFGQSTESYHVIHFQVDDDSFLEERLKEKMRGPIFYYPRLYVLRRSDADKGRWYEKEIIYQGWLFSMQRGYKGSQPPFFEWPGLTIAIGCEKKANPHIKSKDW